MDDALLTAIKALAEPTRLRIVGLLAEGHPLSVAELSERLGLAPGAIARHLNRLSDAGLVESEPRGQRVHYLLSPQRLAEIGGQVDALERQRAGQDDVPRGAPPWASPDQARVLRSFVDGERLTGIPANHAKRLVVLRWLAETSFEPATEYPEKEVNMRLALRHPDVASLRRYLVDEGFMERPGGIYRLCPPARWPLG